MPFACSITIRDSSARRSWSFSASTDATRSCSRPTASSTPSAGWCERSTSLGLRSRDSTDKAVYPLRERTLDRERPIEAGDLEHPQDAWVVRNDHATAVVRQALRVDHECA